MTSLHLKIIYSKKHYLVLLLGKGEGIWDKFCHEPGHIQDNSTGDVASDSYHKMDEDVAILRETLVGFSFPHSIQFFATNNKGEDRLNVEITRVHIGNKYIV